MDIGPLLYHFGEWLKEWTPVIADTSTVVVFVAAYFGIKSYADKQRERQELRDEWFRRFQWALSLLSSNDLHHREVGIAVMTELVDSSLATDADRALFMDLYPNPESIASPSNEGERAPVGAGGRVVRWLRDKVNLFLNPK